MSTTTTFAPSVFSLFSFHATLDGALYNVITTWNVADQYWWINVYDQNNNLILTRPRNGSPDPPALGVNLIAPWFKTSTMYFFPSSQTFVVSP